MDDGKVILRGVALFGLLLVGIAAQRFLGADFTPGETALSTVLHIPEGAEAVYVGGYQRIANVTTYAVVVDFTDDEYAAYVAGLGDPNRWSGASYTLRGDERAGLDIRWHRGQTSHYADGGWVGWGPLGQASVDDIAGSAQWSFCYAVLPRDDGSSRFSPCNDVTEQQQVGVVRGVLDEDRKRLYAYMSD
ncbi:MAG: hypothetical protein KC621_10010 [Myxococcales bacterium]|nr:hypothetical protein [Myxococcales bacterium]